MKLVFIVSFSASHTNYLCDRFEEIEEYIKPKLQYKVLNDSNILVLMSQYKTLVVGDF